MKITIEKLVHGGHGIGTVDGRRIFVPYSAPGDELEIDISDERGGVAFGVIKSVILPAKCRVAPRCPAFGKCGGCQWQHISYDDQLRWKRTILAETLERIGRISGASVLDTIPSPCEWHYRNRIQLHVDAQGRVGYYMPRSREVVEFETCFIAEEGINRQLNERREEFRKRTRGVALRIAGDESFSQVNSAQNKVLADLLCAWLSEVRHGSVLELYAGSGNFTFSIAKTAEHVTASDIDGRAIREAQLRMETERATNVQFACMPAHRAVQRHGRGCDVVVVDPPRKGCDDSIDAVAEASPASILYISCDPATLARDARILTGRGYRLVRTQPVDMFPQTFHVESLSLFTRIGQGSASAI